MDSRIAMLPPSLFLRAHCVTIVALYTLSYSSCQSYTAKSPDFSMADMSVSESTPVYARCISKHFGSWFVLYVHEATQSCEGSKKCGRNSVGVAIVWNVGVAMQQ